MKFSFSPDQTLLAVVSQDGFLRIFHYEKMELIAYMKSYFGGLLCVRMTHILFNEFVFIGDFSQVCWSPDGKYLATGGEDDFITLFSVDPDEHCPRVLCRGHGHTSWISAISFDPYMNAKNYYSSLIQTSLSTELDDDRTNKSLARSRNDSTCFDTNLPSLFYRLASVGQDNRLCLWDITEDILKWNSNSKLSNHSSACVSSTSNGYASLTSDITNHSTPSSVSTSKSSFSSLTSRLSFVRHSNKIHKTIDESSDITVSNGSAKKSRKVSLLSNPSKIAASDESNSSSLSTLVHHHNHASSRRSNFDLTRTTFGTSLCPKVDEIQVIEPVVTELIAHERLNGIYFGENYLLTSSQDGIIAIWEKPQKLLIPNAVG